MHLLHVMISCLLIDLFRIQLNSDYQGHFSEKAFFASALAASILVTTGSFYTALAAPKTPSQVNGEGYRACKALGKSGFRGRVRGILNSGANNTSNPFTLSYCFKTKAEGQKFLDRIMHIVYPVDIIHSAQCHVRSGGNLNAAPKSNRI